MKITPKLITGILYGLNWQGHIELPDGDLRWLGDSIATALTGQRRGMCDNCGTPSVIMLPTAMGHICEDCITGLGRLAEDMRKDYEDAAGQ